LLPNPGSRSIVPSPTSQPRTPTPSSRRIHGLLGALAASALVAITLHLARRPPLLPVVAPARPESLDPQLRDHLQRLASLVADSPRDPARRATLALAFAANGLWPEARQAFLDVVRIAPDEPLARLHAAVALQEKPDDQAALAEFEDLARDFPNFAPAWYRVGEAALRLGNLTNAESAFLRLSQLAPQEWRGPAGLGEVRLRAGKPGDALPFLERALAIDRSARPAHFLLGQALRAVGCTNEARIALALGAATTRHPMPDAWSERAPEHMKLLPDQLAQADELGRMGRPDLALQLLQGALKFHPDHPGLLNQLAVAFNRAGRPQQGLALLDAVLAKDPKAVAPRITRSHALVLLGRAEDALAESRRAATDSPRTAQAHLAVANALLALDRDADAAQALRLALDADPANADIHVELASVLWRNLSDAPAAAEVLSKALQLNPALPSAHLQLGLLQHHVGDIAAARATLASLEIVAPNSPELRELQQAIARP
jgi:tetratricopeptide (TPR) repeat protein